MITHTKEHTPENHFGLSKNDFEALADVHDTACVSIYIPTAISGKEVDEGHAKIHLKNALKDVKSALQDLELSNYDISTLLEPVKNLLDDVHFWRNQSKGLALFLNKEGMQYYRLPLHFERFTYVSNHYYLRNLMPLYHGDGHFYLLKLSQQSIKLYDASRYYIHEIRLEDLVPENILEAVGYDYEQKSLNFHSGQRSGQNAVFHGHGEGKDDKGAELEKFFRAVDKGIMHIIGEETEPLLMACQDQYFPVYSKITRYKHLYDQYISGNPQDQKTEELQQASWEIMKSYFEKDKNEKLSLLEESLSTLKFSSEIEDILPAAVDGRIDTVFMDKTTDVYGLYDSTNRTVLIDEGKGIKNASLTNLIAVESFVQNAHVYLVEPEDMPVNGTSINALFRY